MPFRSSKGQDPSVQHLIRTQGSSNLGQGIGGGGGGAASSPLTNPIYSITFSSAPGPSGNNGQTYDLLEQTDFAHRFPGPGTWTFSSAATFPATIEIIGGGGAGGGGGNNGTSPGNFGGGGGGGDTVFSGTPVGIITANGGSGGPGGGGGNAGDAIPGTPGTGGSADISSASGDITFAETRNGADTTGRPRSTGPSSRASSVEAQVNYNAYSIVAGSAEGGGPGSGPTSGSVGGGGGAGQGAYIRSNAFDIVAGVNYTFTVGGGGNGGSGPGKGPGGSGNPGAASLQINFYEN